MDKIFVRGKWCVVLSLTIVFYLLTVSFHVDALARTLEERVRIAFNLSTQDILTWELTEILSVRLDREFISRVVETIEFGKSWDDPQISQPKMTSNHFLVLQTLLDAVLPFPILGFSEVTAQLANLFIRGKREVIERHYLVHRRAGRDEEYAWSQMVEEAWMWGATARGFLPRSLRRVVDDILAGNPDSENARKLRAYCAFVWESIVLSRGGGRWEDFRRWILSKVPPSDLRATVSGSPLSVNLSWRSNSKYKTGFLIERRERGLIRRGAWTELARLPADVRSYSDTQVTKGQTYEYRVSTESPLLTEAPTRFSKPSQPIRVFVNLLPIANAGLDQTVPVNSIVQLDGRGSFDPDGDEIKSYQWTILPRENSARCIFRTSNRIVDPKVQPRREGSCTIELQVTDARGARSVPDQVVVTVRQDITPPGLIQNFQASDNEDSRSTLTWTNPSDGDLAEIIVRRKLGSYPTNYNDSDLVYQNASPTPGAAVTHTDTGLTNGTTYYYAVFSRDRSGNWNDQVIEGKNADTGRPSKPWLTEAPWPMFQNNAQHTGQSAYSGPVSGNVSWTYDLGSIGSCWGASLQPVVDAQGIIYFGVGEHSGACDNRGLWGKVYAFNQDGTIKWQSSNLGTPPYGLAIGSDGTIYVSTIDKGIIALNSDGTEKWRFYEEGLGAVFAITIGKDGTLYFTDQQRLYSVNADGSKQWTACCWPYGSASGGPAVAADGTIYVVWTGFISGTDGRDGILSAYAPDGTLKWRGVWLAPYASAPVIGPDNTIYVVAGAYSGTYRSLYAFNSNGDMLWQDPYRYGDPFVPVVSSAGAVIITESQRGFEPGQGACFISYLRAFNSTGDIIWTWGPEENLQITVQPILDVDSNIFIGGTIYERRGAWCVPIGSRLYRINFQGTVDWSFSVSGSEVILSFALGANRHLYAVLWKSSGLPNRMITFYALGESTIQNTTTQNIVVSEQTGLGSVQFSVPGAAALRIELFNLAGRKIYDSDFVEGSSFRWNGFTNDGQRVANGVYLYVVTIRKQDGTILRSPVKKLVILR